MRDLFAVPVVFGFWVVVFGTMLTLVLIAARNHDDGETVCKLGDAYFALPQRQAA